MGLFSFLFTPKAVNSAKTSTKTILNQMNEPRALPMGVKEFHEWSDRIISGALIPSDDPESLKAVLASMLTSLGPTEDHKPDSYFIHLLRKAATNEVARHVFMDIKNKREAAKTQKLVEDHVG